MSQNITWDLESLTDESVQVIQWHGFWSIILICFCCAFAIISTAGKGMIIYYILYKAPKRPMNTMILFDQVSNFRVSVPVFESLIVGLSVSETESLRV